MGKIWSKNEFNIKIKYIKDLKEIANELRDQHDSISILVKSVCRDAYHIARGCGAKDDDTYIMWQDMIDEEMDTLRY